MMRGKIELAVVAAMALGMTTQSIRPVKAWANPIRATGLKTGRPGAKFARKAREGKIGKIG